MLVAVTTIFPSKTGFAWWPMEVPYTTLAELREALIADGVVSAIRYDTHLDDRRRRVAHRATPIILGKGIIATVAPLPPDFMDVDPNASEADDDE